VLHRETVLPKGADRQRNILPRPPAGVLARLRTPRWRRIGLGSCGLGIALLGIAAFAPLPAFAVVALGIPGLALLTVGAFAWLARDPESWRR